VVDEAAPLSERVPLPEPAEAQVEEPGTGGVEPPAVSEAAPEQVSEDAAESETAEVSAPRPRGRRGRERGAGPRGNALGALIEQRFADPSSPVRSYSELERRSAISREALSRYVTPRADRRRSPTIDTLAAISDALHLSLEQVCRAAVASARGITLPPESEQRARDEVVAPLVAPLTEDQFSAVVELLRQMSPR
jgi:transcriptional regulator with XRE-family HTH domain